MNRPTEAGILLWLASALLPAPGQCRQLERRSIIVGSLERSFSVYKPGSLDPGSKWPVLIALHGGPGDAAKLERGTELSETAEKYGFLLVYPEAGDRRWNDGRAETDDGIDDVEFVSELIDRLGETEPIDKKRVHVAGISNGGHMSLRLACELNNKIDSFGALSASFPEGYSCRPGRPVSFVFIHGRQDPIAPWLGGELRSGRGLGAGGTVIPLPETVEYWRDRDHCSPEPVEELLPNVADDGTRVAKIVYEGCAHSKLALYEIFRGGHGWPGSETRPLLELISGRTSQDISANEILAEFFGLADCRKG